MSRIPEEFRVVVPEDRTAQYPANLRDESKLLLVDRQHGRVGSVGTFRSLVDYVGGDLIVVNETRVLPVRMDGLRPGGGRVELLFLTTDSSRVGLKGEVYALISPGRRLRPGLKISLPNSAELQLLGKDSEGRWRGIWSCGQDDAPFMSWLERHGKMPLPPYIHRQPEAIDVQRYQTTYAREAGSLAAPTAGLHFTPELFDDLKANNCDIARLLLDVGLGTFLPIRTDDLTAHRMHEERYSIPTSTIEAVNIAKQTGRNVTAVGTTVVRALEDAANEGLPLISGERVAELFIYPPYDFKVVERLLTNFHRPDSTLLQLVAAFIGWDLVNLAYQTALDEGFRFYSYGDAMLII